MQYEITWQLALSLSCVFKTENLIQDVVLLWNRTKTANLVYNFLKYTCNNILFLYNCIVLSSIFETIYMQ